MNKEPEKFTGKLPLEFTELPSIKLVTMKIIESGNFLQRIAEATRRRYFTLNEDWEIKLEKVPFKPGLEGTIVIPRKVNHEHVVFDGASVPLPWLVSFLSIGMLRPLGVMLTASIVHDFAFKFGYLLVKAESDQENKKIEMERHETDALFRDIIITINKLHSIGVIAWFFVRLGWLFGIRYKGRKWTGKPPYMEIAIFAGILTSIWFYLFDGMHFQVESFKTLVSFVLLLYFIFYLLTVITLTLKDKRKSQTG